MINAKRMLKLTEKNSTLKEYQKVKPSKVSLDRKIRKTIDRTIKETAKTGQTEIWTSSYIKKNWVELDYFGFDENPILWSQETEKFWTPREISEIIFAYCKRRLNAFLKKIDTPNHGKVSTIVISWESK